MEQQDIFTPCRVFDDMNAALSRIRGQNRTASMSMPGVRPAARFASEDHLTRGIFEATSIQVPFVGKVGVAGIWSINEGFPDPELMQESGNRIAVMLGCETPRGPLGFIIDSAAPLNRITEMLNLAPRIQWFDDPLHATITN